MNQIFETKQQIFRIKGTNSKLWTGLSSGHYAAAVYCRERNTFYYCNDERISEIDSLVEEEYTSTVNMVIYE